jgi:hypothetical protein
LICPASAKDPNETLKFAIGAYFSDPSNSVVLSSTKKMMGSLMFVQKEGAGEWTEKRVEQVGKIASACLHQSRVFIAYITVRN